MYNYLSMYKLLQFMSTAEGPCCAEDGRASLKSAPMAAWSSAASSEPAEQMPWDPGEADIEPWTSMNWAMTPTILMPISSIEGSVKGGLIVNESGENALGLKLCNDIFSCPKTCQHCTRHCLFCSSPTLSGPPIAPDCLHEHYSCWEKLIRLHSCTRNISYHKPMWRQELAPVNTQTLHHHLSKFG